MFDFTFIIWNPHKFASNKAVETPAVDDDDIQMKLHNLSKVQTWNGSYVCKSNMHAIPNI